MRRHPMDYDNTDLPEQYDEARNLPPQRLQLWLDAVARHLKADPPTSILDLGCGTGRFSAALAHRFSAHVTAIDPSIKMLERANAKLYSGVTFLRGSAESIPLPSDSVDLVFASMVFHHLRAPALAFRECRRVLRSEGILFIRNGTSDIAESCPFVPFFSGTLELLQARLPSRTDVISAVEQAGLRPITHETIVQRLAGSLDEYATKLALGGDSVLAELSPAHFAAGLRELRKRAKDVDPAPVNEPIDVFTFGKATTADAA